MNDFLTDDTKAILLLCSELGKTRAVKPLTQTEYNRLGNWLIKEKMRPADLLQSERVDSIATSSGIESNRLQSLLGRGVQLGLTVEQWQQNSIWILSRSDEDYPGRYKEHLKIERPPLLFGVGDKSLLQGGGVAIVGSRDVDSDGEHFAREVGKSCAKNRISVVSGGARGVDQIVMSAALEAGGVVIGVLADDLLKKSLELETRRAIADDRLLLISSYHPTAHFTIGRAMERNKLIYALADCALVVSSDYKKGGTWTGVAEELERDGHRPIFVRSGANVPVGNKKLLGLVVHEYDFDAIKEIVRNEKQDSPEPVTGSAATIPKTSIYESVLPIIMSHLPFRFAELKELAETLEIKQR